MTIFLNTNFLNSFLIFSIVIASLSCEQIKGCTDSLSTNFDPEAEIDDGSCSYLYGGKDYGQLDIGALSNLGESFDIYFDGSFVGTLNYYFDALDFCGSSDAVGRIMPAGNVLVEAQGSSSGQVLYSTVRVDPQECNVEVLDYFQTGTGGSGGSGGGAGGTCDWMASTECISVSTEWGVRCNSETSLEVTVKNTCSGAVKVYICVQEADGSYSNWADGNFDDGVAVGEEASGYACDATGEYLVGAMPINDYVDNDCPWPSNCQ